MSAHDGNPGPFHEVHETGARSNGAFHGTDCDSRNRKPVRDAPASPSMSMLHDADRTRGDRVFVPRPVFGGSAGRGGGPILDEVPQPVVADGRYTGGNANVALDLRVDLGELEIVSGDFFGVRFGRRDYVASFRTVQRTEVGCDGSGNALAAIFEDRSGNRSLGEIVLRPGNAPDTVFVTAFVEGALPGLPARQKFDIVAEWQSSSMRRLRIELEMEQGTTLPPSVEFNNQSVTIFSAFSEAGFELRNTGQTTEIPSPSAGWGHQQLHALMLATAASDLSRSEWRQQLLWLGRPSRRGLLGIMFDSTAQLPRQGTAVFDGEIRRLVTDNTDRKVIQTAVHEIGHALNLAHRFEREVGRADSFSFMNYDWRYGGGNRRTEFWQNFKFQFDRDELEFLRHGPRDRVIPGGAAFRSVNYWADGSGGYSPYLPEAPLDTIELQLEAPIGGNVFAFGQPVLLKVTLVNRSPETIAFNRRLLDPKGSFLEVMIRRVRQGASGPGADMHFHPVMERCLDVAEGDIVNIPPGGTLSDNLNVTFGVSGFSFAEPGSYDVQVFGTVVVNTGTSPSGDLELIAPSNSLRIHVAHPHDVREETEVLTVLLRHDVGTFFALGGSDALPKAREDLDEVCARRMHRRRTVSDPVAANIIRCKAIDTGRWSLRREGDRFVEVDGDPATAVGLLAKLEAGGNAGLRTFDAETARSTMQLMERLRQRTEGIG